MNINGLHFLIINLLTPDTNYCVYPVCVINVPQNKRHKNN